MISSSSRNGFSGTWLRAAGEPARLTGRIIVTQTAVEFTTQDSTLRIPFEGLSLSRGGSNDRLIYIKHPLHPNDTFFTTDPHLLAALRRLNHPHLTPQIDAAARRGRRFLLSIVGWCVALIVLVGALLWAKDPLAGFIAHRIPIEWESKAGELIAPTMTVGALTAPQVTAALERFVAPLAETVKKSGFTPRFFIVPNTQLNAFALPGGTIVIFSAVIERAESGEEVLGVIAHELAHVTERHVMKNIVTSVGLYALFSFFIGDAVGGIAAIANTAPLLLSKSYSRDLERAADKGGLSYLLEAQIDPRGMARFFERVLDEEDAVTDRIATIPGALTGLQFLNTHPDTQERIAALHAAIASLPATKYRSVREEYAALRQALTVAAHPPSP